MQNVNLNQSYLSNHQNQNQNRIKSNQTESIEKWNRNHKSTNQSITKKLKTIEMLSKSKSKFYIIENRKSVIISTTNSSACVCVCSTPVHTHTRIHTHASIRMRAHTHMWPCGRVSACVLVSPLLARVCVDAPSRSLSHQQSLHR